MTDASQPHTQNRRRAERQDIEAAVSLRLPEIELEGGSANLSKTGIYFVTGDELCVEVWIQGEDQPRRGRIVRVGQLREGELGVAVRLDPQPGQASQP
jgi:hypothetical protein